MKKNKNKDIRAVVLKDGQSSEISIPESELLDQISKEIGTEFLNVIDRYVDGNKRVFIYHKDTFSSSDIAIAESIETIGITPLESLLGGIVIVGYGFRGEPKPLSRREASSIREAFDLAEGKLLYRLVPSPPCRDSERTGKGKKAYLPSAKLPLPRSK